jgi:hypothetical protein
MLEEKIILAKLFINYNFESVLEWKDIKMVPDIILRPYDGVRVIVVPRNK